MSRKLFYGLAAVISIFASQALADNYVSFMHSSGIIMIPEDTSPTCLDLSHWLMEHNFYACSSVVYNKVTQRCDVNPFGVIADCKENSTPAK